MCGQTGWKYTLPPYFRSRFNLTIIHPLELVGLGKILHIFEASVSMFQIVPLILKNSP